MFGYRRALSGQSSTAHPHYDAKRACHYNYIADFGMKSLYRLCRIGDDGKQRVVAKLPVERPAYMHSFGMSEDHLVLTEFPLVVSPIELKFSGKPFIQNYRWEPERGLVFHIVEKDTGKLVRTATADATFAFHHVNAFADGDRVAVDAITYPDATIIDQLYLAKLRSSAPITATGTLTRFHISVADDAPVTRRILADVPLELPRINYERHAGKPYRYVWGTGVQTEAISSIHRQDRYGIQDGRHLARGGSYPGEPVFVPRRQPQPRMTGCCCRWCSTSKRSCLSCSCSMRRAWPRSRGRLPLTPSPSLPRQFLPDASRMTTKPWQPTFRPKFKAAPFEEPPP